MIVFVFSCLFFSDIEEKTVLLWAAIFVLATVFRKIDPKARGVGQVKSNPTPSTSGT